MSFVASFIPSGRELDPKQGSYYSNMTGFWHGDVQLHNLTALNATDQASPWRHLSEQFMIPTNLTAIPELQGPWNWTRSNKVTLNVGDKLISVNETKSIAIIHVSVRVHKPRGEGQSPGESFHRTQTWGDDVAIRFLSRHGHASGILSRRGPRSGLSRSGAVPDRRKFVSMAELHRGNDATAWH